MPSVSKSERRFFGYLKGNPAEAAKRGISPQTVHDFASTPEAGLPEHADMGIPPQPKSSRFFKPKHMEDGDAPEKWIQGVTESPDFKKGSLTRLAHKAGETPMQFAHQHVHSPGKVGAKARFAVNVNK